MYYNVMIVESASTHTTRILIITSYISMNIPKIKNNNINFATHWNINNNFNTNKKKKI